MKKQNLPKLFNYRDNFIDSFDRVFDQMVQKQFPTFTDEFGLDFLTKAAYPKVDVVDFKDRLEITSEIPGLTKKDISIEVKDGVLTISGQKKDKVDNEDKGTYIYRELKHSSFKRSFTLSDTLEADKIKAKFENGILNISIPKTEPKVEEAQVIDIE
jgi:HSP20 family protein|tara:strand:+ start:113 stop:583 length:471 start_codon:yes stop_codon:yes gene_type:complete